MKKIKLFSRYDLLILIAISAVAIILLIPHLFKNDSLFLTVTHQGEVIETVKLNSVSGFREIKIQSTSQLTIRIENGRARVIEAECEDKLCVNCGWLDSNGDMAVCLPAGVVVSVEGSEADDADTPDVITF